MDVPPIPFDLTTGGIYTVLIVLITQGVNFLINRNRNAVAIANKTFKDLTDGFQQHITSLQVQVARLTESHMDCEERYKEASDYVRRLRDDLHSLRNELNKYGVLRSQQTGKKDSPDDDGQS